MEIQWRIVLDRNRYLNDVSSVLCISHTSDATYEAMKESESNAGNIRAFLEDFERDEREFCFLLAEDEEDAHQTAKHNQTDDLR